MLSPPRRITSQLKEDRSSNFVRPTGRRLHDRPHSNNDVVLTSPTPRATLPSKQGTRTKRVTNPRPSPLQELPRSLLPKRSSYERHRLCHDYTCRRPRRHPTLLAIKYASKQSTQHAKLFRPAPLPHLRPRRPTRRLYPRLTQRHANLPMYVLRNTK